MSDKVLITYILLSGGKAFKKELYFNKCKECFKNEQIFIFEEVMIIIKTLQNFMEEIPILHYTDYNKIKYEIMDSKDVIEEIKKKGLDYYRNAINFKTNIIIAYSREQEENNETK